MKIKRIKCGAAIILLTLGGVFLLAGEKTMADTVLYRGKLENNKNRSIVVKQSGKVLTLSLEGFGKPIVLNANGGGTSTCRTTIEHNSAEATVLLSLGIPNPGSRCASMPSFVSIQSKTYDISLEAETIIKISGANAKIRSVTAKILGKIEIQGEG